MTFGRLGVLNAFSIYSIYTGFVGYSLIISQGRSVDATTVLYTYKSPRRIELMLSVLVAI